MARLSFFVAAMFAVVADVSLLFAQQATVAVPQTNVSNSFYEFYGIHWGYRGKGFFFDNGGFRGAVPQFGGFDPNSAAQFGFGGNGFFFNMMAGQGSDRSNVSGTSMLTLPNGGMGSVFDTSLRPFVVGVVPVVGNGGVTVSSPLQERLHRLRQGESASFPPGSFVRAPKPPTTNADDAEPAPQANVVSTSRGDVFASGSSANSTATRGDLSVAEIRRQQASEDAERDREIESLVEQARGQEELGKPGLAKLFYQQAARRATGDRQRQLAEKIRELNRSNK